MAYFVNKEVDARPLSVGIIQQTILAPVSIAGEDSVVLIIQNTSGVETFEGWAYSAPNLTGPWTQETNDEFQSVGPGVTRRMVLPADRINVRVLGNFQAAPGTLKLTVTKLRSAVRRA